MGIKAGVRGACRYNPNSKGSVNLRASQIRYAAMPQVFKLQATAQPTGLKIIWCLGLSEQSCVAYRLVFLIMHTAEGVRVRR